MSYANTPKAATITPAPIKLHTVRIVAPPKMTSENITRTMVSRLPTDAIIGPHMPKRIINPALKKTPDAAIPAIVKKVSLLVGNEKGSKSK